MRSWPSAVSRMRSQLEQNGSETGLTNPISPAAVGEAEAPRRRGRLRRQLLERAVTVFDDRADLRAAQDVVLAPRLVGVEWHELDEADDVRLAPRELGERRHLGLRESLDRDAVDLDRAELGMPLGLLEAAKDGVQRVAPRDLGEAHVVQRVQRDVDAPQPGLDERRGEAVEQHAVRRE